MPKWRAGDHLVDGDKWILQNRVGKVDHVWVVCDHDGTKGVAKRPRLTGPPWQHKKPRERFHGEVEGLERLSGVQGVLPLIDRDPSEFPEWFVMPMAMPIAAHLRDRSARELIIAFRDLADTLTRLEKAPHKVAHRDIKPDNLFWWEDQAVFGDFGIAAWNSRPNLTSTYEKVGPLAYLADEALQDTKNVDWHAADVYSLAKSIWSLAKYRTEHTREVSRAEREDRAMNAVNVPVPPKGDIDAKKHLDQSMAEFIGRAGTQLDQLVIEATSHLPARRPTADVLRDELVAWLWLNPASRETPAVSRSIGWPALIHSVERFHQAVDILLTDLQSELRSGLTHVAFDPSVRADFLRSEDTDPFTLLDSHGRDMPEGWNYEEDEPEPEPWAGACILRLRPSGEDASTQVFIGGVIDNIDGWATDLLAEIQHLGPTGSWDLVQKYDRRDLRPGWPATRQALREIITEIPNLTSISEGTAWIADRLT